MRPALNLGAVHAQRGQRRGLALAGGPSTRSEPGDAAEPEPWDCPRGASAAKRIAISRRCSQATAAGGKDALRPAAAMCYLAPSRARWTRTLARWRLYSALPR